MCDFLKILFITDAFVRWNQTLLKSAYFVWSKTLVYKNISGSFSQNDCFHKDLDEQCWVFA